MKAIVAYAYGSIEQLKVVEIDKPLPSKTDVLVKIKAAGVNLVDTFILKGYMPQNKFPLIPGWDFSGVVEEVGEGVTDFIVGDDVYGYNVGAVEGTYAEYAVIPETNMAKKPSTMSYIEAAAIPCVGLTAYQTLVDKLNIQKGETVLITAAAGGVGTLAVQIAIELGAHVIGTASGESIEYVKNFGAEYVIDYKKDDWVKAVKAIYLKGVDVIFTPVSGETKTQSPSAIRDGGRLAWISGEDQSGPPMERFIQGTYSSGLPKRETFEALTKLIDTGKLKLPIATVYPLDQAGIALERMAKGNSGGKLIIEIA